MTDTPRTPPEGFERMPEGLGFGDRLQPFYRRVTGRDVSFGFFVASQHLNMMGICHGGALMTLADIAAATSIHLRRDRPAPSPTINLSFDFQSPGMAGHWLQSRADHVDLKRRFGFCTGVILDGDTVVLRYSGTFYNAERPAAATSPEQARAMAALLGDDAPLG
jgi:uncharacterized protein (TIGR00369 family)